MGNHGKMSVLFQVSYPKWKSRRKITVSPLSLARRNGGAHAQWRHMRQKWPVGCGSICCPAGGRAGRLRLGSVAVAAAAALA